MIKKIVIDELKAGMYVSGFEKESGNVLFFMNNIRINEADIKRFQKNGYSVIYIDIEEEHIQGPPPGFFQRKSGPAGPGAPVEKDFAQTPAEDCAPPGEPLGGADGAAPKIDMEPKPGYERTETVPGEPQRKEAGAKNADAGPTDPKRSTKEPDKEAEPRRKEAGAQPSEKPRGAKKKEDTHAEPPELRPASGELLCVAEPIDAPGPQEPGCASDAVIGKRADKIGGTSPRPPQEASQEDERRLFLDEEPELIGELEPVKEKNPAPVNDPRQLFMEHDKDGGALTESQMKERAERSAGPDIVISRAKADGSTFMSEQVARQPQKQTAQILFSGKEKDQGAHPSEPATAGRRPGRTSNVAFEMGKKIEDYQRHGQDEIKDKVEFKEEIKEARKIRDEAENLVKDFLNTVKLGQGIRSDKVHDTVGRMVNSVFCNQDALASLTRLKSFDNYTFAHSVNVCILSMTLGRHIGFKKEDLHELGVGAILHDIGKMLVPENILNKPGALTPPEFDIMKRHALLGAEILHKTKDIAEASRFVALQHQEKFDGTGYPNGISGTDIHLYARIATVADVYDAMTSKRVYNEGMPPENALKKMYMLRGKHFESELVERLIRCLGIYPIGTLVELNTGEMALVRMTNHTHPVQPLVLMLFDRNKKRCKPFEVNLKNELGRWIISSRSPENMGVIVEGLIA